MSTLLSLLILSAHAPSVTAADNATGYETVGWVSDPGGRGTFSLVFSCLLTLGLCVWSAMHLNIPAHDESPAQMWSRHIKWGLLGVVAPELIVLSAWRQYNSAKTLHMEVTKYLRSIDDQSLKVAQEDNAKISSKEKTRTSKAKLNTEKYQWTMVHSFYAGMGGFFMEVNSPSADDTLPFVPKFQRLTLSARGIALLAKCGHLPIIPEDDIADKSKADGLSKFLVCVQALWMLVQVIARIVLSLPVTLLEVNTLGHVLCALVIYLLWWHKPRLVQEPTKIEGDWVESLCAYMYISSQVSGRKSTHAGMLKRTWIDPELSNLALFVPRSRSEVEDKNTNAENSANAQKLQSIMNQPAAVSSRESDLNRSLSPKPEDNLQLSYFAIRPLPSNSAEGFISSGITEQAQNISNIQLNRWRLAAEAVHTYPAIRQRFALNHNIAKTKDGLDWLEPIDEELVTKCAPNWPSEDLLRGTGGLIMGMILWFASMAYGGVHMAAWNDHFPSIAEKWLWRVSAIDITASGFVWLVVNLLAHQFKAINAYWDSVLALRAHWTSYLVLGTLCTICGVAYIFARMFLVVEAFISIRQLPIGAYYTPDWTQLIPHF